MTEKEQATALMDKFIDLQRIKAAEDREKETECQGRTASMGKSGLREILCHKKARFCRNTLRISKNATNLWHKGSAKRRGRIESALP